MKWFKSIGHVCLATALLVATTGVTLSKHYCLGRLQSVSVFEHAKGCAGTDEKDPLPCCDFVNTELKVEEITQASFEFDSQTDYYQIAAITWILTDAIVPPKRESNSIPFYDPPPPDLDIQSYFQVYRI